MVVVWLLVTTVAMAFFKGQTVGKRIAGIRVVIRDQPVGFGFSLLRDQLLRVLYLIPLFFLVDSIWAAADSQRQTLRDKIVGSHVVHAGANARRAVAADKGILGCITPHFRTPGAELGSSAPIRCVSPHERVLG